MVLIGSKTVTPRHTQMIHVHIIYGFISKFKVWQTWSGHYEISAVFQFFHIFLFVISSSHLAPATALLSMGVIQSFNINIVCLYP